MLICLIVQLAKEQGEHDMREVAARTEEDADAEIQALTQKCAFSRSGAKAVRRKPRLAGIETHVLQKKQARHYVGDTQIHRVPATSGNGRLCMGLLGSCGITCVIRHEIGLSNDADSRRKPRRTLRRRSG